MTHEKPGANAPRKACVPAFRMLGFAAGAAAVLLCGTAHATAPATGAGDRAGVRPIPCPENAVPLLPGTDIQATSVAAGPDAVFCIKAGIHLLQSIRPQDGQQFHGEIGAVLSGASTVPAARRLGRYWMIPAPLPRPARGQCEPNRPCTSSIGMFLNDQPMTQVSDRAALKLGPFFYLDVAGGRIYLGANPLTNRIEIATATYAFHGTARDVVIRNLVVEKYANPAQEGAIQSEDSVGWRIENVELRFNAGAGVALGTDGKLIASNLHHNGQLGATAGGNNILLEGNVIWANNIFGFDPGWEAGAVKVTESTLVTFRGNHVHRNRGDGLWCDIECRDVLYEDNLIEYNDRAGIFHEISYRAVIRNNVLRHNGQAMRKWLWGGEIQIAASEDVEIYNNVLTVGADGRAIMLIDQGRPMPNNKGRYKTRNNYVHHNDVTFERAGDVGGASDVAIVSENFGIIEKGNNRFDSNTYRFPRGAPPDFMWGVEELTFDEFRKRGQEPNGVVLPF